MIENTTSMNWLIAQGCPPHLKGTYHFAYFLDNYTVPEMVNKNFATVIKEIADSHSLSTAAIYRDMNVLKNNVFGAKSPSSRFKRIFANEGVPTSCNLYYTALVLYTDYCNGVHVSEEDVV